MIQKEDGLYKVTAKIDGMMCGMCEAHIADTIRKAFPDAKKVSASRKRGEATFLMEREIDRERLRQAIEETGYMFVSVSIEPYQRRGLFGR